MRHIKLACAVMATAALMSSAQAAPVYHIHTECTVTVTDAHGHKVGQRVTIDDRKGLVARMIPRSSPVSRWGPNMSLKPF